MGLSLSQRREAEKLQLRGNTLREIARNLEVSFEEVCLSLFGGVHDWSPRIGSPAPSSPVTLHITAGTDVDEARLWSDVADALNTSKGNDNDQPDDEQPRGSEDTAGARAATPGASAREQAEHDQGGAPHVTEGGPAGDAPTPPTEAPIVGIEVEENDDELDGLRPPLQLGKPGADAETKTAEEPRPVPSPEPPPPAAPAAEPAPRRYRLTNGAGEYLHKSGSGMTRNKDAAWSGTAQQMEEAFKRKPALKELDDELVR